MARGRSRPSGFVSLLLLLAGVLLFWMTVPHLGTAARAATADGPRGTFTAARLVCAGHSGHTTCEWAGTFRSDDGTVELVGVKLYGSGRDTFEAGRTAPAVDVGNAGRVYDPTGSRAWIITVVLVVLAYVLLVVVARRHLIPPLPPETEVDGGSSPSWDRQEPPRSAHRSRAPAHAPRRKVRVHQPMIVALAAAPTAMAMGNTALLSGSARKRKLTGAVARNGMTPAMDSSVLSATVTAHAHTNRAAQTPR